MTELLTALALVLVVEGVLYALAPGFMQNVAAQAAATPPSSLRAMGLIGAAVGVFFVWVLRG